MGTVSSDTLQGILAEENNLSCEAQKDRYSWTDKQYDDCKKLDKLVGDVATGFGGLGIVAIIAIGCGVTCCCCITIGTVVAIFCCCKKSNHRGRCRVLHE